MLLGAETLNKLKNAHIAVFGVGGVGGYVVEALARSGVGQFDLIDNDTVALSNINRQIIATHSSVGKYKVDVMKERILDINPDAKVAVHKCFFLPDNSSDFDFKKYTYIVDAIDTVTAKLELIVRANEAEVPIISSMGTGNKLDPTRLEVSDIYSTQVCPLARVMRTELKKRGIEKLKVVYSKEQPIKKEKKEKEQITSENMGRIKDVPGSVAFVPSVAGLIIAGEVIKDIKGE
ncbi:MAG: tRNA threonylcarbamoyladenosine dehydratase [Lachnospiraceae bacterium]|nr:tRNA threonylcarbamoyladenosine dehydratase [Lachnospiraceae bacterium]